MESSVVNPPERVSRAQDQIPGRLSPALLPPPKHSEHHGEPAHPMYQQWASHDPRSSSTQSLVPSESGRDGRRTLLLIYIHGFLGNETSFQSFPAHVHNLVTILLAETHIVHTKIYPRYKSRKTIDFAANDFSNWLAPHESPQTDVILLGHSMGGILSAEVVLLPPRDPDPSRYFRHRILGTVNFDTPFLGMHPGVITSGIGSLFRPAPDLAAKQALYTQENQSQGQSQGFSDLPRPVATSTALASPYTTDSTPLSSELTDSTLSLQMSQTSSISPFASPTNDPNYNPPFPNDVRIPVRKGWDSALHFFVKHSDGIRTATKQYVTSHLEFGGCLADYPGLKNRYDRIRGLEDFNELDLEHTRHGEKRVRFVNYYTASTGRLKNLKSAAGPAAKLKKPPETLKAPGRDNSQGRSSSLSPRISIEEHQDNGEVTSKAPVDPVVEENPRREDDHDRFSDALSTLDRLSPTPMSDTGEEDMASQGSNLSRNESAATIAPTPSLPPIPPSPPEPPAFDASQYPLKDERKLAEKAHARAVKAYKMALKDRAKTIKERQKLLDNRLKKERAKREKDTKEDAKQLALEEERERGRLKQGEDESPNDDDGSESEQARAGEKARKDKPSKSQRDRKFCVTPSKEDGRMDPTWIRVFMEGVDEVGAHCGLFFLGQQYEKLVGDVGARIEEWVKEERGAVVAQEEAAAEEEAGRGGGLGAGDGDSGV